MVKVEQKVVSDKDIVGDTLNYLRALATVQDNILLKSGLYRVTPVSAYGISMLPNSIFSLENGAVIKVNPSSLPTFYLFNLRKVNNVKITGGEIIGDKYEHIFPNPTEDNRLYRSEHIHAINIDEGSNISIFDMKISKFIGDAIQIVDGDNLNFKKLLLADARMKNLGIRFGRNFIFEDVIFEFAKPDPNSNFTNLGYGVDIEPFKNKQDSGLTNIKFINCVFRYNKGFLPVGLMISLYGFTRKLDVNPLVDMPVSIYVINPLFEGCGLSIISANDRAKGFIYVENATFIDTELFGLYFRDHVSSNVTTIVKGAKFINCGTKSNTAGGDIAQYIAPISFWVNANESGRREIEPNRGTKNIIMSDIDIVATNESAFKKFAIQNYATTNATNNKVNDLQYVEITNLKVVGYDKIFHNQTGQGIDPTFKITYSNES